MPAFPVLHYLPELDQTHVHGVSDAIQPSHSLPPSSPPALNLSRLCYVENGIGFGCHWVWVSLEGRSEKAMAPHSSTLAWKIPWMEEPGRLQSMGSLRVRHDLATSLSLFTFMHWRRNGNPLQCSCLENPRDGGAWWAAVSGVAQSRTQLKRLSSSSSRRKMVTFSETKKNMEVEMKNLTWDMLNFRFLFYSDIQQSSQLDTHTWSPKERLELEMYFEKSLSGVECGFQRLNENTRGRFR